MSDVTLIRKKMGRLTFKAAPRSFLDTGSKDLNAVLGRPDEGLVYGKIVEITGMNSNGKTVVLMDLAATAQRDKAHVIWGDLENSFDRDWAARRGLSCAEDADNFTLLQPYLIEQPVKKGKKLLPPLMATGEELLEELGALIAYHHSKGKQKIFVAVDSIAALLTEDEGNTAFSQHNMRTDMDLSKLLSKVLRKWVGMAAVYNAMIVIINQLRTKPVSFGDPLYSVGGGAIPFYAHVRVRVNRGAESRIKSSKTGKVIGIKGILANQKNKVGGVEQEKCKFKVYFDGRSQFLPAKGSD